MLSPGTRIGPYEIVSPLGAGGMGEVYRGRDPKLNRDVAIKVLLPAVAGDPDRLARFSREAQVLASLNHPNIAQVHGVEEAAAAGGPLGSPALIMELVEGPTLADRLALGPLPLDEVLHIAKQIAEALEAAHEQGIVHRDLKPANVKIRPDGAVKVLDFGLAKALGAAGDSSLPLGGSMSPTLSLAATYAGVILGTAAYMAPEQAKGKATDRRADVWAFGVVLYEMLTGERRFSGDSVAETLASVMKDQLTFGSLPGETPPAIRTLVTRCLERDVRRRLQAIGEARIVIDEAIAGAGGAEPETPAPPAARSYTKWAWALTGIAVLAAVGAPAWIWTRPEPVAPAVARFMLAPPEGTTLTATFPSASQQSVSPDGRYLAFVADEPGRPRTIWVRALDSLIAQRLDRTERADYPFWSPDSRNIGYFADGKLMRISVAGGAPLTVAAAPAGQGGTWFERPGGDGVILFSPDNDTPLLRVLAQGGVATPATALAKDQSAHAFPQFLPGGERFLYLARGAKPGIFVQALGSDEATFVVDSIGRAVFSPPGFLLYLRDATLLAHRWNLDTWRLEGEPVAIAPDVRSGGGNGRNGFAVSASGVLVYRGGASAGNSRVSWYSREGKSDGIVLERGDYGPLELSPDNRRLLVIRGLGDERDLWLKDLVSGVFSRLTTASGAEVDPIWSPDSQRVAYAQGTERTLFETIIGSGKHTPISVDSDHGFWLHDWTRDGNLVIHENRAVSLLPVPGNGPAGGGRPKPQVVFNERYTTDQMRISPDGGWVAYTSVESNQPEIMIASFPGFADRRQISTAGAVQPSWRADGRELFFVGRNGDVMAVDVTAGTTLTTGPARILFQVPAINTSSAAHAYAATRDGKRFLIREPAGEGEAVEQLYVVTNWTSLVGQ